MILMDASDSLAVVCGRNKRSKTHFGNVGPWTAAYTSLLREMREETMNSEFVSVRSDRNGLKRWR
jgi:hypothetical protein